MNFGKLMSKSVDVFSRKGISGNSASDVNLANTITKYHTNILIFSLLFVIFAFEQSTSAQSYKHMEIPVALIASAVEQPNENGQPTEEIKPEVTRPRFVNPRVTNVDSKIAENKLDGQLDNKFYFPLKGLISSSYGENRRTHRHKGIDIAAPSGTLFYPAASGKVVFAGWQSGYGNTLIIEHGNGSISRYAHAQKLLVACGDVVGINDPIAAVGSTGRSTGPHLHFEIMDGYGRQVNPLQVLYKRNTPDVEFINETAIENVASNSLERDAKE